MFRKLLKGVLVTAAMVMAGAAWAKLPPPPVNQNLGIPDGAFSTMTAETCLGCHGDPANAPAPVKIGYLPDRHHLRVGTPIDPDYSASPYPNPELTHTCFTCHEVDVVDDPNSPDGQKKVVNIGKEKSDPNFRNCMRCHEQKTNAAGILEATVHHLTDKAQRKQCHACHGSLINDPTDDHRIPDPDNSENAARHCGSVPADGDRNFYDISIITPWPGDYYDNPSFDWKKLLNTLYADCPDYAKRYYDPEVLGGQFNINPPKYKYEVDAAGNIQAVEVPDGEPGGRRTGNCAHCHDAGENPGDAVQPNTGLAKADVGSNKNNHHATGVGRVDRGSVHSCTLCHGPGFPGGGDPDGKLNFDSTSLYSIRGCEVCHGVSTLHLIEFDGEGDGIDPGMEKPFMGHIGNTINCNGCHLNFRTGQVYQASTGLMDGNWEFGGAPATVSEISTVGAIAGTATEISIKGTSLQGPTTRLELVGTDGNIIEVPMEENDNTSAKAILPADVPADNYELYVTRGTGDKALRSLAIAFLVAPQVSIDNVSCSNGTVTITGSGFGSDYAVGSDALGVTGDGSSCSVDSWSDTQIVANCGAGTGSVTVGGLFGEASSDAACGGTDAAGRPKWWSIWSWWSSWSWSQR